MGQHQPLHLRSRRAAPTPRLKPGVLRVPRPDGIYIGNGERGVLLHFAGAAAVTERLDGTRSRVELAIETGVSKEQVERILASLARADLLDRDYASLEHTPTIQARLDPELAAAAHRPGVTDGGAALLARRSSQRVDLLGGDRSTLLIATGLAASGIGHVRLIDDEQVTPVDVIGAGLRMSDVGAEREAVGLQRIREAMPAETPIAATTPDLTILTRIPMPEELRSLASNAHLLLSCDAESVTIGPLVLPGKSACSRCIALHQVDRDRHWGVIEMERAHRRDVPSTLAAHLAAANALVHALAYLDTGSSVAIGATIHISLADGFTRPRIWQPHPRCGCGWS